MLLKCRFMIVIGLFACSGLTVWANPAWADLDDFIRKPEPNFAWKQNGKTSREQAGDQSRRGERQRSRDRQRPRARRPDRDLRYDVISGSAGSPSALAKEETDRCSR